MHPTGGMISSRSGHEHFHPGASFRLTAVVGYLFSVLVPTCKRQFCKSMGSNTEGLRATEIVRIKYFLKGIEPVTFERSPYPVSHQGTYTKGG